MIEIERSTAMRPALPPAGLNLNVVHRGRQVMIELQHETSQPFPEGLKHTCREAGQKPWVQENGERVHSTTRRIRTV